MKTLKIVLTALVLLLTTSLYIACSDENTTEKEPSSLDKDIEKINSLLKIATPLLSKKSTDLRSKMAKKEEQETLMITFLVVKNNTTGQIALTNFKKDSYFPVATKSEYKKRGNDPTYTVSCSKGGKTTSSSCGGKWSCGGKIAECLEAGGCATICQNPGTLIKLNSEDFGFQKQKNDLDIRNTDDYSSIELSFIPSL